MKGCPMRNSTKTGDPGDRRERITVQMSGDTRRKLDQVLKSRPRGVTLSDVVWEAIENYLSGQEDQIGSRQHFSRSLQRRIDQLEARLVNYLNLMVFMEANGFAQVVQSLTDDSSRVQPGWFIKVGVEGMARDGEKLTNQLRLIEQDLAADAE
jgi:hypothetical protein